MIISKDGKIAPGVLSEPDIIRASVHRGTQTLNVHVDDFITLKFMTRQSEAT